MFKLDLVKAEGPKIKLPTSFASLIKQESQKKKIYVCFFNYAKAFDCVDHNKMWKTLTNGNARPSYLSPEKSVCGSRSNSLNPVWS